jgi:hypothetical protein
MKPSSPDDRGVMKKVVPLRLRRWQPQDADRLGFRQASREEGSRGDSGWLMWLAGALAPLLLFGLMLLATGLRF